MTKLSLIFALHISFFVTMNTIQYNALDLERERTGAWNLFLQPQNTNIKGNLQNYKKALGEGCSDLTELCSKKNKSLWELDQSNIENEGLFKQLQQLKWWLGDLARKNLPRGVAKFIMYLSLRYLTS